MVKEFYVLRAKHYSNKYSDNITQEVMMNYVIKKNRTSGGFFCLQNITDNLKNPRNLKEVAC